MQQFRQKGFRKTFKKSLKNYKAIFRKLKLLLKTKKAEKSFLKKALKF